VDRNKIVVVSGISQRSSATFFDFDAPLFRTVGGLITNPGKVIKEYICGK